MGQYFKVCNLDKKQYLHPHKFGDGLKLMEFGASGAGTMAGLAILLADNNGRGGGDCRSQSPVIGTWATDRIVITGEYADRGTHGTPVDCSLYTLLGDDSSGWVDISESVIAALRDDGAMEPA